MPPQRLLALLLFGVACAARTGTAAAEIVYKCRAADGALTYQDRPCPPGTEQPAPRLLPPPPYEPPAPEATLQSSSNPPPRELPQRPPPPPPVPLFRCSDAVSGKSRVSATPDTNPRSVPLWTVMPPSSSLGGLSADVSPAGRRATASLGAYTTVEDHCRAMQPAEMCGYWRQHLDEVDHARKLAFNDTRPQLEQEAEGLREQLTTYCAR